MWISVKLLIAAIGGTGFWAITHWHWSTTTLAVFAVVAAATVAAGARFLAYWSRNLGDGIPWVGRTIRITVWTVLAAVVLVRMAADPWVGIGFGALWVYTLMDTHHERVTAAIRRLRLEDVALPPHDPDRRRPRRTFLPR